MQQAAEGTREDPAPGRVAGFLSRPPGWPLHLLCVGAALIIIADSTGPARTMSSIFGGFMALCLGVVWLFRLVAHVVASGPGRRRFLIAPAGAAVLLALLVPDVPLQARWALSQGAFEKVIKSLPTGEADPLDVPDVIGTYGIVGAERVPGGVIFHADSSCGLFGDAGFGWFPDGPDVRVLASGSFEDPRFSHIRGPWYRWCASW